MKALKLYTKLNTSYQVSADEFVHFWKAQYNYPRQELYNDNIILREHTGRSIYDLLQWKNGMNLSSQKQLTYNKIIKDLPLINRFRQNCINQEQFEESFGWMSTIWKIFLKHIITPTGYPIFDQHVYRAYRYLHKLEKEELRSDNRLKEELYHREYLPFYLDMQEQCSERISHKDIDEALWAFGKFLSLYPNMVL